ncbi:MAG: pilus motility taxis protein HmpF, partial [Leptolyngbyaceae cyanobacterium bins.59]|nr:pilus motility taxis protein HmpF [Leptolyngbyaceae cyanobacterium bins.59]
VDLEALEKMPLDELEVKVKELQQDFEKLSSFVNEQEEELTSKAQTIDELQARMEQASEYDRLSLENDLADERDGYRFLEETLEGQRRTLRQKEEELGQNRSILMNRKGHSDGTGAEPLIDLGPVVSQIEAQRQQQAEEISKLEAQISQMRTAIQQAQSLVEQQTGQQEQLRNEIKQQEETLRAQQRSASETIGRVNTYQETLQPIQDHVNGLRQRLDAVVGTLSQVQEAGDYQLQAITEMRQILQGLLNVPEFAS